MIGELTEYYAENGILSTKFHCKFQKQCAAGSKGLIKGKAAYIGAEYEKHSLPRILFVSLDPGSDQSYETPQLRTPLGVRSVEENRNWQAFHPLLHWYATHKLAITLAQVANPSIDYRDANKIFAHTNCVKCCYIKENHEMSGNILYKLCKTYLRGELEILDPDILLSQGKKAEDAIRYAATDITNLPEFQPLTSIDERIHILSIKNHPVLYIRTVHPSWRNDRTRKQEQELFPIYKKAVETFLNMKN